MHALKHYQATGEEIRDERRKYVTDKISGGLYRELFAVNSIGIETKLFSERNGNEMSIQWSEKNRINSESCSLMVFCSPFCSVRDCYIWLPGKLVITVTLKLK